VGTNICADCPPRIDRYKARDGRQWAIHGPEIHAGVNVLEVRVWVDYGAHDDMPVREWRVAVRRLGRDDATWAKRTASTARRLLVDAAEYLDGRHDMSVARERAKKTSEFVRGEARALLGLKGG